MVLITHCLEPPKPGGRDYPDPALTVYAFDHWVDHTEDWCRKQRPEEPIDVFLSRKCSAWKLDHSYASPLTNDDYQPSSTPHSCPLVTYPTHTKLFRVFWYLHQPSEAHGGMTLRLAAVEGNAALVRRVLQDAETLPSANTERQGPKDHPQQPTDRGWDNLQAPYLLPVPTKVVVDPNVCDREGRTALMLAACGGHIGVVAVLLADSRVDVDARDRLGRSALMHAAHEGQLEVARALLSHCRVEVGVQDMRGWSTLVHAVRGGHVAVVQELLADSRVDVGMRSRFGWDALIHAAYCGYLEVVQMLLADSRVDVGARDDYGSNALIHAASAGHVEVVRVLLADPRVDASVRDDDGSDALIDAAAQGHVEIVQMLLAHPKVDVGVNQNRVSALMYVACTGQLNVVQALLASPRVDVNSRNQAKCTALILAVGGGQREIVDALLVDSRVDVQAQQEDGWTSLMYAAFNGEVEIVRSLLARGADPNTRCNQGKTAIIHAFTSAFYPPLRWAEDTIPSRRKGCFDCIDLLLAQPGIDVHEFEQMRSIHAEL